MEALPLNRATSLRGLVNFLRKIGAPVDSGLEQAKLPVLFEEQPLAWISSVHQWQFVADMARREGIEDLGFRAALDEGITGITSALREPLQYAPTLYDALVIVSALVRRQAAHLRIWLEWHSEMVSVCHVSHLDPTMPGYMDRTWHTTHLLIEVVREFAGADWQPSEIVTLLPQEPARVASATYPNARLRGGQVCDAIIFPQKLLVAMRPAPRFRESSIRAGCTATAAEPSRDFVTSLRYLLRPYLLEGYPSLDLVAELAGCSRRTLQRRLSTSYMTYSKLVELVRFDAAVEALGDPDKTLIGIALELGYCDQATFARAFVRWTGMSPGAFRRQCLAPVGIAPGG